jgi:hypothetical protein
MKMKDVCTVVLLMAAVASIALAQNPQAHDYPGMVTPGSPINHLGVTKAETLKATYSDSINNGGIFTFCSTSGCLAPRATIDSLDLTCPGVAGKTCTYDVQIAGQVESGGMSINAGEEGLYSFFIDNALPNGGGTDPNAFYAWQLLGPRFQFGTSYNVHSTVTNTVANQKHNVTVGISCFEVLHDPSGCFANAGFQTLVVRVFTP